MMDKIKEVKDKVIKTVEETTDKIEEAHKKIAAKPFEILEKAKVTGPKVDKVKDFQDKAISKTYEVVRNINKKAGDLATDLIGKVAKEEAA